MNNALHTVMGPKMFEVMKEHGTVSEDGRFIILNNASGRLHHLQECIRRGIDPHEGDEVELALCLRATETDRDVIVIERRA